MGRKKKCILARMQTNFKKGRTPHNKGLSSTTSEVSEGRSILRLERMTVVESQNYSTMLLRRRDRDSDAVTRIQHQNHADPELDSYRILHLGKTVELFNSSFKQHWKQSPKCTGSLTFDFTCEVKHGLGWQECLQCTHCEFKSQKWKLYNEVVRKSRGRRPADLNLGLQIGLNHNGLGNSGFCNILQALNIPPPCLNGMQQNSNSVGTVLIELNEADMGRRCNELSKLMTTSNTGLHVEGDCRYNNSLTSGFGITPFQPASQATYTLIENSTRQKQVIGVYTANKLCKCADKIAHSATCSANIDEADSIGNEEEWAYQCYKSILQKNDNLDIELLTSDGDNTTIKGIQRASDEFLKSNNNNKRKIINAKCVRHLGVCLKRKILKTQFSKNMFPGRNNKERY